MRNKTCTLYKFPCRYVQLLTSIPESTSFGKWMPLLVSARLLRALITSVPPPPFHMSIMQRDHPNNARGTNILYNTRAQIGRNI